MAEQDPNTMVHTHVDENGNVITHCHGGEGHTHAHPHTHTQTKAVINRLARAIGHLESVKRMVEDGRDCAEVLIQLAAVRSALNNTAKIILKDHIDHCLADAVETGDQQAIDELNQAIEKFMFRTFHMTPKISISARSKKGRPTGRPFRCLNYADRSTESTVPVC
mgnify:CR=1 FL=1